MGYYQKKGLIISVCNSWICSQFPDCMKFKKKLLICSVEIDPEAIGLFYLFDPLVSMLKSFRARCFTSMAPLHYTMVIIPEEHPVLSCSATASRNPSEADLYC